MTLDRPPALDTGSRDVGTGTVDRPPTLDTGSRDVGTGTVDRPPALDAGSHDAGAIRDAGTDTGGPTCNLTDNIPDDCYDVPLPSDQVQSTVMVQGHIGVMGLRTWRCSLAGRRAFPSLCFTQGDATFPSGNWRNAVFNEGQIVSIEMPATLFSESAQIYAGTPSWVGDIGQNGGYDMSISRRPGDFTDRLPRACVLRSQGQAQITIENANRAMPHVGTCRLEPDKTYYLNIRLVPGTCTYGLRGRPLRQCSHSLVGYGNPGW